MGRSRGDLTTKIHALVAAIGRPILLKLSEGQAHDGCSARDMFASVTSQTIVLADRAHDSAALRATLAERGACANIRPTPYRVYIPPVSSIAPQYANAVVQLIASWSAG